MKALKAIALFALAALFATPVLVNAQEGGKKGGRGGMNPAARVEQIDKAVTLTADQKTKITAILEKAQSDMQALPQEDRRTKGREIMQKANEDVRAVLTPDQQKKYDEMPAPARGKKKKDQ